MVCCGDKERKMKKIFVVFALLCVFFLVSCGDGSKKVDTDDSNDSGDSGDSTSDNGDSADSSSDSGDTGNSGNSGTAKEGVYLGIIGFNEELFQDNKYSKEIGLLNSSTESGYTSFINNLYASKGTALYYADYKALEMMGKSSIPPKLQKVALVTFTDGLDNLSVDEYDPENYDDPDLYLNAIHDKILKEKIHGQKVEAFSIGLKGREEGVEPAQFEGTLKKLASSDSKAFLVSDMDEVMEHFDIIAKSLYSATTTVNLAVLLPGGYKDGELLRFTFDSPDSAADSELYIEATFRKTDNGRSLEKISYEGFAKGEATILHKDKVGAYYRFVFEDMKYDDGKAPAWNEYELRNILQLWRTNSSGGWYTDSEFDPASSSELEEEKSSALIMLVLDCTTSLGSDFSRMQEIAKDFVETLVNGNSGNNDYTDSGDSDTDLSDSDSGNSLSDSCPTVDGNTWSLKSSGTKTWSAALDYCDNLTSCGYSDWRLPNINELRTLIQNCPGTQTGGACAVSEPDHLASSDWSDNCYCDYMKNNGGYYSKLGDDDNVRLWSSSTLSDYPDNALYVYFDYGRVGSSYKDDSSLVRCVR